MTSDSTRLIMGIASGYSFTAIRPFVISLRDSGYEGDLVLFAQNPALSLKKAAAAFRLTLIPYNEVYPYLPGSVSADDPVLPATTPKELHLFSYRHIVYYRYLQSCGKDYSQVMLTDVRDVVFQRHPFHFLDHDGLYCFLEEPPTRLQDDKAHNAAWIRGALGESALQEIGAYPISCAGIVVGSANAVTHYLQQMIRLIFSHSNAGGPTDQALHNYLVHRDHLAGMRLLKNGEGPVLTIGRMEHGSVRIDANGNLLNNDGTVPAIIHQYDRHPDLHQHVLIKYYRFPERLRHLLKTIRTHRNHPRLILGSIRLFARSNLANLRH